MTMMWLFAVLVVLVMGGVAMVAAGRGAPMSEAYDDRRDALVPAAGELGPRELRTVRFSLAFRGYRMSEVDALLDRLAAQLGEATTPEPAGQDVADNDVDDDVDDDVRVTAAPEPRGDEPTP